MGLRGRSYTRIRLPDSLFSLAASFQSHFSVMAVLIPRSRTIGVRLSEEEYSALEMFSVQTGARSISDVARTAICKFVRKPVRDSSFPSALEHARQISDLEQKVLELNAEISSLKAERALNAPECGCDGTESGQCFYLSGSAFPSRSNRGTNCPFAVSTNNGDTAANVSARIGPSNTNSDPDAN